MRGLKLHVLVGFIGFLHAISMAAADGPTNSVGGLSISSPTQLQDWQKHLTLGPGDVLQVSMYGEGSSTRPGLVIGPDGRLNYLQARDVMASGLTVEELRAQLETVLLRFYRPPVRVMVVPQAYKSKKYYLLGSVVQNGVFSLDQPVTIVEAIAKAQGFVANAQRRSGMLLVDLSHSFLARKAADGSFQNVNIDFEALFLNGDLRQNQGLAPDDYLYFPPLDIKEIYVLGDVRAPGVLPYDKSLTAIGAIASKGGFGEKAYKSKVLVIRGSLQHPQAMDFNAAAVLDGKTLDFKLEPGDIIYVSRRPWAYAEELLEAGITEFMRAAIVSYTGQHVGPFIKEPIIK
ncbi:MAG: polysaccharide export protein Wza [Verrucomicrobiales bacterium]|nr:polysaccharide export protein Wza [Verrucomicrobiales bacterium]